MGLIDIARNLWTQIRNETVDGANTAIRVGNAGSAILDVVDTKVETIINPLVYTIGQTIENGIVAYILQIYDTGYDANVQKGLMISPTDSIVATWEDAMTGKLPTKDQLLQIWTNKDFLSGFTADLYWTSTEFDATKAYCVNIGAGYPIEELKTMAYKYRQAWTFENSLAVPDFDEIAVFANASGKIIKSSGKKLSDLISGGVAKSDYDLAVDNGYIGTLAEWLLSLKGAPGVTPVKGVDYTDGTDGINGQSAYQIAVANGYTGTLQNWLSKTYTLDFQTNVLMLQEINMEGAIQIIEITGINVASLTKGITPVSLGVQIVPIPVTNNEYITWSIVRTAIGFSSVGIKYIKV